MADRDDNGDGGSSGSFFAELSRRSVFRVAAAYTGLSWVLLQVADTLFPALGLPDWAVRLVAGLLVLGFPIAVFLAWAYTLTPEGLKRDHRDPDTSPRSGRAFDLVILLVLLVAIGGFAVDYFVPRDGRPRVAEVPSQASAPVGQSRAENVTIAVLPFLNMSADEEQAYFADGLTEELLGVLSRYRSLQVIGRTSSFQFKDKSEDLRRIGEQLGADYLLEGSVRKYRNTVRITAQLVAASDGVNLWSNSFTRELDDIFALQEAIAGSVAAALQMEILGPLAETDAMPVNAEAYDLYLRALRASHLPDVPGKEEALDIARRAVALDPTLAPAWVVISKTLQALMPFGVVMPQEGAPKAREAVQRALNLDPDLPEAYEALGGLRMTIDWDWEGAEEAFSRALELDPSSATALSNLGLLSAARGDMRDALRRLEHSQRVDPLSLGSLHNLALVNYFAGNLAEAEAGFREALEFAGGGYTIGHVTLGLVLIEMGRFEEALAEGEKAEAEPFLLASRSLALHKLGRSEDSDAALEALIAGYGDRFAVPIAGNLAQQGELDRAMDWLDRAYAQRDAQLMWSRVHPVNDRLHGFPRYEAFLVRLGLD